MSEPISLNYNLGRLGQTDDQVDFSANAEERAKLAALAGVLAVAKFDAHIGVKKLSATRFALSGVLRADLTQACVVTLEPLPGHIERSFERELHHVPNLRRPLDPPLEKEIAVSLEDEVPEEIGSLHYDLAVPLMEEFLLAIDPYPRAPGVEFAAPAGAGDKPESPFAVLKTLKSGPESIK